MSRLKDIPALQRDGKNLNAVMQAVQEVIQTFRGYRGDPLDQALTLRNLSLAAQRGITGGGSIDAGIIGGTTPGAPTIDAYVVDPTPPPTPSGLAVSAGITSVFVSCDQPVYTQGHGHDITVVYGAKWPASDPTQPTFSEAVELFRYQGTFSAYTSDPATRWCIWIKWQSVDGVLSTDPAGGTNGVVTTTGQDVSLMVEAMTGPGNPFTVLTVDTVIDGVTFPAGTYSTKAFVQDLQVTRAKIAALAVDDGKVANLSAAKLTAGSIAVGQYIQGTGYVAGSSGWRINGDGTAEFSSVVVRGTIYASAGTIGGSTIGSNYMRSTSYALGMTGWNLNSDGTGQIGGFVVASDHIRSDNYVAESAGWKLGKDGFFEASTGTFRGALAAATGSFAGSLSAATGTFSGSLSAATGTFAGSLSAATGTFSGSLTADAINAVNTINLAGNSVSVANSAGGATTASTSISVPSGQTMRIVCLAHSAALNAGGTPMFAGVNGVFNGVSYSVGSYTSYNDGSTYWNDATTWVGYASVTGPATVSATANGASVTITLMGTMR